MGLERAVQSLTRPQGQATLTGPDPTDDGDPLAPEDAWGHDHLWWLDRMVRTNQPLIERMTLIWHDWFATSTAAASQRLLLDQNAMFRRNALGSFEQMLLDVTSDPAMILWLNANDNRRNRPNENYARELMELFTLGADRGAYTEDDVRELARALTGWRNDWSSELGEHNFRFDPVAPRRRPPRRSSATPATTTGAPPAACACTTPSTPRSWSRSCGATSSRWRRPPTERDALASAYVSGGYQVRPIVEAILCHPQLHTGPRMVKPPVVYAAGYLRRLGRGVDTGAWRWLSEGAGQALFRPPNVSGWDDERWLDSSTLRARWMMVTELMRGREISGAAFQNYDPTETPEAAVAAALAFWGNPPLTQDGPRRAHRLRRELPARRDGVLGAAPVPRGAPERAAPARGHLPRPSDELTDDREGTDGVRRADERGAGLRLRGPVAGQAAPPGGVRGGPGPWPAGDRGRHAHSGGHGPDAALVHVAHRRTGDGRLRRRGARLGHLRRGHRRRRGRTPEPVLVSVFMEGGADSLSVLAPVGDPRYASLRPT